MFKYVELSVIQRPVNMSDWLKVLWTEYKIKNIFIFYFILEMRFLTWYILFMMLKNDSFTQDDQDSLWYALWYAVWNNYEMQYDMNYDMYSDALP